MLSSVTEASLPSVVKFLLQVCVPVRRCVCVTPSAFPPPPQTSRVDQAGLLIAELRSCFQLTDIRGTRTTPRSFWLWQFPSVPLCVCARVSATVCVCVPVCGAPRQATRVRW